LDKGLKIQGGVLYILEVVHNHIKLSVFQSVIGYQKLEYPPNSVMPR